MAVWLTVPLMADNKKERAEQMAIIVKVLQMEKTTHEEVPDFLIDDQKASDYCSSVLGRTDEQYAQDTARANELLHNAAWIINHQLFPDEKMRKKLVKQKYDPEKLLGIFAWAGRLLHTTHPRYSILTCFCNMQLQRRREALVSTMPVGKLVSCYYREYGSSRPTEVEYKLQADAVTGVWRLNGQEVDEAVATEVRTLAEQNKTYQLLTNYAEHPSFEKAPHILGGSPSWQFVCQFEGGSIVSGSECVPVPHGCQVIVDYLNNKLKEVCKNQQNQD